MIHAARATLLAVAITLAAIAASAFGASPGQAGGPSISLLGIDTEIAGNSATSLGAIQRCTSIDSGDSLDIDIVVDSIPSQFPVVSFQYNLIYDPEVFRVTAVNNGLLLAANGGYQPFEGLSDPLPDTDGDFLMANLDAGTNPGETGPGVLSRVTLQATGGGVSSLGLIHAGVVNDAAELIPIDKIDFAAVAVGASCPQVLPEPSPQTQDNGNGGDGSGTGGDGDSATDGTDTGDDGDTGTGPDATPGGGDGATDSPDGDSSDAAGDDPQSPDADSDSGADDDGFPYWVLAPILLGVAAAGGGGYFYYRRMRGGA